MTATSPSVTLLSLDEPSFAEVMGGPMQTIIARAAAARDRRAARAELARVKRDELVSLGVLGKGAFDVQFVDKHKDREERRLRVVRIGPQPTVV